LLKEHQQPVVTERAATWIRKSRGTARYVIAKNGSMFAFYYGAGLEREAHG